MKARVLWSIWLNKDLDTNHHQAALTHINPKSWNAANVSVWKKTLFCYVVRGYQRLYCFFCNCLDLSAQYFCIGAVQYWLLFLHYKTTNDSQCYVYISVWSINYYILVVCAYFHIINTSSSFCQHFSILKQKLLLKTFVYFLYTYIWYVLLLFYLTFI